jgi:hypothetical protein
LSGVNAFKVYGVEHLSERGVLDEINSWRHSVVKITRRLDLAFRNSLRMMSSVPVTVASGENISQNWTTVTQESLAVLSVKKYAAASFDCNNLIAEFSQRELTKADFVCVVRTLRWSRI